VAGAEDAEVTAVQGGELGLVEALNDGEDGSVDEADPRVGVLLQELIGATKVIPDEVKDLIDSLFDLIEKIQHELWSDACRPKLIDLDEDRSWNDQVLPGLLD
jgi:hypothetical protein